MGPARRSGSTATGASRCGSAVSVRADTASTGVLTSAGVALYHHHRVVARNEPACNPIQAAAWSRTCALHAAHTLARSGRAHAGRTCRAVAALSPAVATAPNDSGESHDRRIARTQSVHHGAAADGL